MWRRFVRFLSVCIDTLLPQKPRLARLHMYTLADLTIEPQHHEIHGIGITTLLPYENAAVKDLIKALKYDRAGSAATLLANALADYLREEITQMRTFSALPVVLVPVPLHTSRLRERGFNQVEKILTSLPIEFRDGTLSRITSDALMRTRATEHQTRLSREERMLNVLGAFALTAPISGNIILIDDVTTTGATLTHAAHPLKTAASVRLLALARA